MEALLHLNPILSLNRNRNLNPLGSCATRLRLGLRVRVRVRLRVRVRVTGFAWLLIHFLLAIGVARGASTPEVNRKDAVIVDEKTEAVIKGALKYLASRQNPNGSWAMAEDEQRHPIAITGYTLMAFQAAGQLPGEGEYGKN